MAVTAAAAMQRLPGGESLSVANNCFAKPKEARYEFVVN